MPEADQPDVDATSDADEGPCVRCGAQPGYYVEFDQNIGLLLYRYVRTWKGIACRDCATEIGRRYLRLTMLTGWWGAISAPANLLAIRHDLSVLRELRTMPGPSSST